MILVKNDVIRINDVRKIGSSDYDVIMRGAMLVTSSIFEHDAILGGSNSNVIRLR